MDKIKKKLMKASERAYNISIFLNYAMIQDFTNLLKYLLLRSKIIKKAQFKYNNFEIYIPNERSSTYYYLANLIKNKCNITSNEIILPNGLIFKYLSYDYSTFCHIYETFFKESYKLLEVNNKVVLDIGASFGDTSIYFAMKGAKKVYAFEPLKEIFEYLLLNVKINNYNDIIAPYNKAISSKKGKVYINPIKNWSGMSHTKVEGNNLGYWVDSELLKLDADILKIDCEGCEYDVFSNIKSLDYEEIMMEFHKGSKVLVNKLTEMGYNVNIISEGSDKTDGIIYAKKSSNQTIDSTYALNQEI